MKFCFDIYLLLGNKIKCKRFKGKEKKWNNFVYLSRSDGLLWNRFLRRINLIAQTQCHALQIECCLVLFMQFFNLKKV